MHVYDRKFFDWVKLTALRSAAQVLPVVRDAAAPASVVDVGCGEGAWLSVWRGLGVADVHGLDGAYVDTDTLLIERDRFASADLAGTFGSSRRFDLAQSLEVAEHLPPACSARFVAQLCALSEIVLFSAAQPGQGGENHINERLPSTWAEMFRAQGYAAYDAVRPRLAEQPAVAPWYRFNSILYANAAGTARLSAAALATRCTDLAMLDEAGDFGWRLRRRVLAPLPVGVVSWLSRLNYRVQCALPRQHAA